MNSKAIIDTVLMIASYTYGPLLGLFAFGIFTKKVITDKSVWIICLIAPLLCYTLSKIQSFGLLVINLAMNYYY